MQPEIEHHPHPADVAPIDPNTCQDIALAIGKLIVVCLVVLALACAAITRADAQENGVRPDHEHPPQHVKVHEDFYSSWMRLDGLGSCCNNQDCFPTIMIQERTTGKWWALRMVRVLELEAMVKAGLNPPVPPLTETVKNELGVDIKSWIEVPEDKIEHNARRTDLQIKAPRDPRDSPDGRSHACIQSSGFVYCAVVGLAQ